MTTVGRQVRDDGLDLGDAICALPPIRSGCRYRARWRSLTGAPAVFAEGESRRVQQLTRYFGWGARIPSQESSSAKCLIRLTHSAVRGGYVLHPGATTRNRIEGPTPGLREWEDQSDPLVLFMVSSSPKPWTHAGGSRE